MTWYQEQETLETNADLIRSGKLTRLTDTFVEGFKLKFSFSLSWFPCHEARKAIAPNIERKLERKELGWYFFQGY